MALTNLAVLARWKVPTTTIELCVRLLEWTQVWAKNLESHVQVWAAMFAKIRAEIRSVITPFDQHQRLLQLKREIEKT